jgi:hypothetical protein
MSGRAAGFVGALAIAFALVFSAFETTATAATTLDREVARFIDPESSDAASSNRFVPMRELVVQTWLEAAARAQVSGAAIAVEERDVRAALERLIIETILGARPLPASSEARVATEGQDARAVMLASIGGAAVLTDVETRVSGTATGAERELTKILARRARAELYLEVVVADVAAMTDADVRAYQPRAPAALASAPYADVSAPLRAYLRALRLREAGERYYQAVRGRIHLEIIGG